MCFSFMALGFESRELRLKTQDVKTGELGAGHVGSEVYLDDIGKWIFIDRQ